MDLPDAFKEIDRLRAEIEALKRLRVVVVDTNKVEHVGVVRISGGTAVVRIEL